MSNLNNPILGRTTSNDIVTMSDGAMNHNIVFMGESGSGKTYAAMAFIIEIFKSFDKDKNKKRGDVSEED